MNIFRIAWLDYLVTYVVFIVLWSLSRAVDPLIYLPTLLFAYYVYRGSNSWLFETTNFKKLMSIQLIKLENTTSCKNHGIAMLSYYSLWWTLIYLFAMSSSYHLAISWL